MPKSESESLMKLHVMKEGNSNYLVHPVLMSLNSTVVQEISFI